MRRSCLSFVALVCVLAIVLPGLVRAQGPVRRGALSDANGETITSAELREWIDDFLPASMRQDMILVFSQCFGFNWFQDFLDQIGTDVTMLAASDEDKESTYNGVHVAYSEHLKPGNKVKKMQDEGAKRTTGAASGDTIGAAGSDQRVIGGSNSTHVIVWASQPNNDDWYDINKIRGNFAGHTNTTVTVLAGSSDLKDKDGNVTSFAATKNNLKLALASVGLAMWFTTIGPPPMPNAEQFITMDIPPEEGQSQVEVEAKVESIERIEIGPVTVWERANPADTFSLTAQCTRRVRPRSARAGRHHVRRNGHTFGTSQTTARYAEVAALCRLCSG